MKFLATIREFTSILFNRVEGANIGENIEIKPASTTADSEADKVIDIPDGNNASDVLVLEAEAQTLSNKSIDSDNNTITNIVDADIKALAAIDSTKIADGSVDNTEFEKLGTAGTNATGELVTTDGTQTMSNKTFTSPTLNSPVLDTPLINDLSDDNTYTVTPSELSTNVNVTLPALSTSDSFVFEAHSQTLTNKTIDADNNTISNLAHGAEVDNPSSGVHGVTGSVVGTTDAQTLTNKSIDADNNTITNIDNADIKASAAIEFSKMEDLSSNFALLSDGSGDVAVSTVTSTELTQLAGNTFGGSTSGDVVTVDGTQTLSAKTISELKYNETNITSAASIVKPSETVIHLTGIATPLQAMTGGADGDTRLIMNDTNATVVIEDDFGAEGFSFGSDINLNINGTVQVIYDSSTSRWRVIGVTQGTSVSTASYARIFLNM